MKKIIEYLRYFLCGLVFGTANVIPGVSGGTMLVVFGIFDKLTEAISGVKKIFQNIRFLITFGLGAGAGIVLSAFVISSLFESFGVQTNMFFIGLILGGVPLIYKLGTAEKSVKPSCAVPFVIAMAVVVGLTVLERLDVFSLAPDVVEGFDLIISLKLIVCAAIAAVTMIIPGISGSFVMMLLGVYETIIGAVKDMNFLVIIPFAIGAVIGIIGGAKLISVLIGKNKLMVYSALMGLVIGSVYAILPEGFGFNLQTGYGFACALFGVMAATLVEKLGSSEGGEQ
ncbi:MAG: DUF368 domain-containing protein [Lachnospiraceae bacterium]|nr:DUF368 domain-containing protein [Ruminococcus sp.]MCM1275880.1 DUF368 domain-containing protein [Lachnospiraceae bacterium]